MRDKPSVSVIICSYNRALYITEALQSLWNQDMPHDSFEVIVVDNNSTDNTEECCLSFIEKHKELSIRYMTEKQQGSSFARNAGAFVSKAPLLCFMDDDALACAGYIRQILLFFENHPDATGMGGRIIPKFIPEKPKWMSYYVSSLTGNFDYSPITKIFRPGKYPLESNMIVKKEAFDTVGGFNTALPGVKGTLRIGGEGKDFFLKLQHLGGIVYYDPSVQVQHVVEVKKLTREYMYRVASGIGRGERVRTLSIGRMAYVKKIVEYVYKLCGSAVLALFYCLKGQPAKAMPVIRFRVDALKGLFNR